MLAYHNDKAIKQKYVDRVKYHIKADNLIRGIGWLGGKGCAVGCTLEDYDHTKYPIELGIPEWLAKVEDTLFEGMSLEKSKKWPLVFMRAIKVGADLEKIKGLFLIYIMDSTLDKFDHEKFPNVKNSINRIIELYKTGGSLEDFRDAADVAYAAADAAVYDAAYAAAFAAANAARDAAYAAANATYAAADAAVYDNRTNAYDKFADTLLKLLRNCK